MHPLTTLCALFFGFSLGMFFGGLLLRGTLEGAYLVAAASVAVWGLVLYFVGAS